MDIGFVMAIRFHPAHPEPLANIYRNYIDEAVYAEELGFDHIWNGEHHFKVDAWSPAQFPVLSAIAARTSHIRLGTHVIILPLYHPLRVAEDAAVLDLISNGRLDLVAAVGGGTDHEYETYGIPLERKSERMFESLSIIRRCFTEERFDHEGKFFTFRNVQMTTKPVQNPFPLWVAAFGPQNLARAIAGGYHLMGGSLPGGKDALTEARQAAGYNAGDFFRSGGPTFIHLAKTRERAWDEAEEGIHWSIEFYRRYNGPQSTQMMFGMETLPPIGELRNASNRGIIVGTPDDALAYLERYRNSPMTHIQFGFHQAGQSTAVVRSSMELFAEKVMPVLRTF